MPTPFQDGVASRHLSFNGQLHFRCPHCEAISWADIIFGTELLKGELSLPCPNCHKDGLASIKFVAIQSRICQRCATSTMNGASEKFTCAMCGYRDFRVNSTLIYPEYPRKILVLLYNAGPLGESVDRDLEFIQEYVRGLRMAPEFHANCFHFTRFIVSLFENVYCSSEDALEFFNAASALMGTVYRESLNPDAGYFSIALMMHGRELALDPRRRAIFGFNVCQNIYSVLAKAQGGLLSFRFGFSLKDYGIEVARESLVDFESIDEPLRATLKARQKLVLGDILKTEVPTESQIDAALELFDAVLLDSSLPAEMTSHVRESAVKARSMRRNLSPTEQAEIQSELDGLQVSHLAKSEGLQRIVSLNNALAASFRSEPSGERQTAALGGLGEAIQYVSANDPPSLLRHAGTLLSRLASGFAAERFAAGVALEGILGVEAFRALAIQWGDHTLTHRRARIEGQAHTFIERMLGVREGPINVATSALSCLDVAR